MSSSSALCFGKLPSQADFIRFNAASPEALAFDEWLHHGLYFARTQLGTGWEQTFAGSPSYRFIFNPDNAGRFLAGIMHASQDKSQRRYPFLVSLVLDRRWFRDGDAHLAPSAFSLFFDGAGQLLGRALNGLDVRQIADATQALHCPEPDPGTVSSHYSGDFLEKYPVETFWRELFGSFDDPRKYLLFNNLAEVLLQARKKPSRTISLGLRFPLPVNRGQTDHVVSLWLNIAYIMLGAMPEAPCFFWNIPDEATPGYLFLFFRQPSPKNFVQLLKPDAENDNLCQLDEEGSEAPGKAAATISSSLKALLDRREGFLNGFLKGLMVTVS